jgi:hypothetical protein
VNARARKIQEARERLLQATAVQGGRRKPSRRRLPRAHYPKVIEATYAKELVALLRGHIREAFAPLIAELPAILETAARERDRIDYDPNQPRAEDGRFGEVAGDKKSGGDKPAARKGVPEILNRAARPGWLRNDRPMATAMKALADRNTGMDMVRARAQLDTMHLQAGLGDRPKEINKGVRIDKGLDVVGADGVHSSDGQIGLSPDTAARLERFAQRWTTDPEGTRAKLEAIPKALGSATAVEEALKEGSETRALIDDIYGMHALVHETIHGFGPIATEDKEGATILLEEVVTEMATRAMIRDNFGYDLHEVRDEVVGNGNGNQRVPAPYQDHIRTTMQAIGEVYGLSPSAARHVLEAASVEFKRQELDAVPWSFTEERLAGKVYAATYASSGYGTDRAPAIKAAQDALDAHYAAKPPRPIMRFARTLEAVLARGPTGTGAVDVFKPSEKSTKFDRVFYDLSYKYL